MYFKGGPRRMAHEAELTQALHALMPRHFPATLAYDADRHWWLTPGVPGSDLASAPVSEDVWLAAIKLLATAQRKAMTSRPVTSALAHRRFGAVQCSAVATRVRRMLADGPFKEHWSADRLDTLEARLDTAIDRYFSLELPVDLDARRFRRPQHLQRQRPRLVHRRRRKLSGAADAGGVAAVPRSAVPRADAGAGHRTPHRRLHRSVAGSDFRRRAPRRARPECAGVRHAVHAQIAPRPSRASSRTVDLRG